MIWRQEEYRREKDMDNFDIRINLDPVNDGLFMNTEDCSMGDPENTSRHVLLIGTNGNYKLLSFEEGLDLFDKLQEKGVESAYICGTDLIFIYAADHIVKTGTGCYFVGSGLVFWSGNQGLESITKSQAEHAMHYMEALLVTLKADDKSFSAFELD
jgi:hypothetical protein